MLSFDDQQLIQRDPTLPGLATLLDVQRYEELLQPLARNRQLTACRCVYLRYKRGTNCLAAFEADAGLQRLRFYATAFSTPDQKWLRRIDEEADSPEKILVDAGCRIVVRSFPNDRRLSSLTLWNQPELRHKLLSRAAPRHQALHRTDWSVLRYKPERRFVALLYDGNHKKGIVKFYERTEYERAWRNIKSFASTSSWTLPTVAGHSDRHCLIVTKWLCGTSLDPSDASGSLGNGQFEAAGTAVARLHRETYAKIGGIDDQFSIHELSAAAETTSWLAPELRVSIQSIVEHFQRGLASTPSERTTIHGDFSRDQVLALDDGQIGFLDFDNATQGDPCRDLGSFLGCLERDAILSRITAVQLDEYRDAFLAGYRQSGRTVHPDRVACQIASKLVCLASEPFRLRMPNWRKIMTLCVERALTIVAGHIGHPTCLGDGKDRARHVGNASWNVSVEDPFLVSKDPSIPWVASALTPNAVEQALAPLLPHRPAANDPIRLGSIKVLRHKPGRRCLVQFKFHANSPSTATTSWLGKIRMKGLDVRTYRLQKHLWTTRFGYHAEDGIQVPRPVGTISAWNMWLQEEVPGTTMNRHWESDEGAVPQPFVSPSLRVAEAIYKLHRSSAPTARTHCLGDELRILQDRLRRVVRCHPNWENRLTAVLAACRKMANTISPGPTCLVHRDFYPDQIIVDSDRVYLLDLDLACDGDPALDIGNFVGHMIEHGTRSVGGTASVMEEAHAFMEAYCHLAGTNIHRRIHAYTTLTLVRHIYISTLFRERADWTAEILDQCEQRLDLPRARPRLPQC